MSWILVTGASKGLGREICFSLAKQGHNIAVHYFRNEIAAQETVNGCRRLGVDAHAIRGDFESQEQTDDFIKRYHTSFPSTKGLVNNVGHYLLTPLTTTSEEDWRKLFQLNVNAPFSLIQSLIPSLKKHKGHIVNIGTSGLGSHRTPPEAPAYSITKMALLQLTLNLAKELARDQVKVNMVSPGYLETSIDLKDPKRLPMGRAASINEAAKLVASFFSDAMDYVTGQNIEIAGGVGL